MFQLTGDYEENEVDSIFFLTENSGNVQKILRLPERKNGQLQKTSHQHHTKPHRLNFLILKPHFELLFNAGRNQNGLNK